MELYADGLAIKTPQADFVDTIGVLHRLSFLYGTRENAEVTGRKLSNNGYQLLMQARGHSGGARAVC